MKNISIIAAIGKNNELGLNNDLIWHLKEDMKFFRKMTSGKTIVMGRKCFESLPGLLPNRNHIIITSNSNYLVPGATIVHNVNEALELIKNIDDEVFIIGGAKIYEEFLPFANTLYLTNIDAVHEADVYFPTFDESLYDIEIIEALNEDGINYSFIKYTKKIKNMV